jgi:hypothetical protein
MKIPIGFEDDEKTPVGNKNSYRNSYSIGAYSTMA